MRYAISDYPSLARALPVSAGTRAHLLGDLCGKASRTLSPITRKKTIIPV